MKKWSIVLIVMLLVITSSMTVFATQPDKSSPLPKVATTKDVTIPAFEAESQHLNWEQKGDFTVYIGKSYSPLTANSLLRSVITYSSSDSETLIISETGKITPLKTGVVVIYATQGNVTIGKKLTVKENPTPLTNEKNKGITLSVAFYSYSDIIKEVPITEIEQINYILSVLDTKVPLPKDMGTAGPVGGGCVLKINRNDVIEKYNFLEVHREIINSKDPTAPNELETSKSLFGVRTVIGEVSTDYTVSVDLSKYLYAQFSNNLHQE